MVKNYTDIFVITVLFTLSIYHIMIYFGRVKITEEKYNFYFAIFTLSIALYILLFNYIFAIYVNKVINFQLIVKPLEAIFIFGIFYGFMSFLAILLEFPQKNSIIFKITYSVLFIIILISFLIFIKGYKWYMKSLFYITEYLYVLCFVLISTRFMIWIINRKLYKTKLVQIVFIGYLTISIYLIVSRIIINVLPNNYFTGNKVLIGFVMFLFTYVSANKFNNEYYELKKLKNSLEAKVRDRTNKLEEANKKVEESSKRRTTFFINLVHETKTPLTLIKNSMEEYLKNNPLTDELEIIKRNIDKLIRDMVNFLDSQKLEHNQIYYDHNQVINLSELINEKIYLFQKIANKKNIKITGVIIEDKLYISADPFAMDRVINNLLDNSIKYTARDGLIKISLKLKNGMIILNVEDNGIGIKNKQIDNLFTPYFQMSHEKRNIQGIGIGLYITKKIIDSLGGTIGVESELGKGSVFTIKLKPHEPASDKKVLKEIIYSDPIDTISTIDILNEKEKSKDKLNIFVIEDNLELLDYLMKNFQDEYNFYYATNGNEALNKIKIIPKPKIIISDVMMDKMNGYDFYSELNKMDNFKDIPLIFLTAKSSEEEKIKGLSLGAVDFITKPFSILELKLKISSILLNKRNQKENNLLDFENKLSKLLREEDNNKEEDFERICFKYKISKREKEVIELFLQGFEYKEIGYKLNISVETVKKHIQNIFTKCEVNNRVELIRIFSKIL